MAFKNLKQLTLSTIGRAIVRKKKGEYIRIILCILSSIRKYEHKIISMQFSARKRLQITANTKQMFYHISSLNHSPSSIYNDSQNPGHFFNVSYVPIIDKILKLPNSSISIYIILYILSNEPT